MNSNRKKEKQQQKSYSLNRMKCMSKKTGKAMTLCVAWRRVKNGQSVIPYTVGMMAQGQKRKKENEVEEETPEISNSITGIEKTDKRGQILN